MRPSAGIAILAIVLITASTAGSAGPERAQRGAGDDDLAVGVIPQRPLEAGEGAAIRRAGIDWTRVWLSWADVEDSRGEYDWGRADQLIEAATDEGLAVLPMLFGSPQWSATRDGRRCYASECIPYAPASDETREAFARFAGAAVRRYGPEGGFWPTDAGPARPIRVWQVWNEQNMHAFWRPRADPDAYGALLRPTASAIREQDPSAEVLLGGMFGPRSRDGLIATTSFLGDLYDDPETAASFDAVAVHPYSGTAIGSLQQIHAVRRTVRDRGFGEPLWVTEIGWASGGKRSQDLVKSRRKQARLVRRTFGRFVQKHEAWNLEAAFWYAWRDTEHGRAVCAWCARSGLISRAGSEKPAYRAMERVLADR